jgi:hypothetical protein
MLECEQSSKAEREPTDYTGLIFAAILTPVMLLFAYLGKAEMGLTVFIILAMMMFAITIRWALRNHVWLWAIIVFILVLHVPLAFFARWPKTNVPTLAYTMPMGIVDFLVILGSIRLAQKLFSNDSSSDDGEEE